ncbi:MAG: 50S ribosomal protein L10 [Candidatus Wolfebacteria bacterium GW2011_GWC2_46_275]|uniref:Large ribosomal subunit protein uL10 n=2 Tax=Candidatus Wolfeibacteriota TaxID=1752735 RepID=A0A0G1U6Y3_9BACT|nr:MAG: 50S ribosomal protein L10, large subunit ribosomal protein L10 [Candidatus Wolfebacteria bacterium GW2011_GWB1_47_1]KKU36928.1 MAG: 50S ribosomal protein L10 [Candidatus Wolfebacteria bacterium GW2011_GWC2_46_275]KKU42229.1 MAG: 50S ribosomal protein L10 [Candidatus Wolfebacteria bacterium GW2011_GWB2_46_69]KKU53850.1 MAG: 50S ribosomal protein L10 [Candidatus Wolfebacteria bacterium GW2011_GWC1_47_103]KKU59423.1 MAG: 50S ribosomal protein L10 [Candidatus Wolfebacteria bacterium GW2011_
MKTRDQKKVIIAETQELIKNSKNMMFVNFTGTGVEDIKELKKTLRPLGSTVRVVNKKLLRVSLEKAGVACNPEQFETQLATIFSTADISEVAGPVFKFFKSKEKKGFNIYGAYDMEGKVFMDAVTTKKIGQLPSREVLLSQLVGVLSAPISMFLYILTERGKMVEAK